ncbi:MAG: hypothetical protein PHZ26_04595 [Candidatus Gracilibacteria bacterium]|nr:hypothetical protein [Candidatus Gracilibacteria bacterium]MDD2909006.1 hypothetical protein [Candidatus Gracilibacteria bacterium]
MFKGKIYVYKSVNGKKEEISKEFDTEKEFEDFLDKNPSLKIPEKFGFETLKWPKSLFDLKGFLEEAEILGEKKWIKEIEKDLNEIFKKTDKLLK